MSVATTILNKETLSQEELGNVTSMIRMMKKYDVEKAAIYEEALENPIEKPKTKLDLYQELMYCIQMYEA